jgi:tetratricopeptide (TPR) repeat protein
MVLSKCSMGMILVLFLTGCGSLLKNSDQSNQTIIPAYSDPEEEQVDVKDIDQVEGVKAKGQQTGSSKAAFKEKPSAASSQQKQGAKRKRKASAIPSPLIVQSLIERAEKAINSKQWLRAQHLLEQALHISPSNAKVFLIYGDVYLNLGILAQAEQMYRRSIALAGEGSAIGRKAKMKLEALTIGN